MRIGGLTQFGIVTGLSLAVLVGATNAVSVKADSFNANNLISDGEFVNVGDMGTSEIQRFLNDQGSYLKDYSENGRSAAQIINDAVHGYGDASGTYSGIVINSSTGTVNAKVLLVTLQKEQSLISRTTQNTAALNAAMGYGCPDSGGCNSTYAGFTKQIENAAWQLRYNYERADKYSNSNFQVGQTFSFDDYNGTHTGKYDNKATAALYRYTPHVYNGNYNFWNMYVNTYKLQSPEYDYAVTDQNDYPSLIPGSAYNFLLTVKNTGRTTWTKSVVKLGTTNPQDREPIFMRESGDGSPYPSGWLEQNRILMQETSVAPGGSANFNFWMQVPSGLGFGTYKESFNVVADGIKWLPDKGVYWNVKVLSPEEQYQYSITSQSDYPSVGRGGATQISLSIKNTGKATWTQDSFHLGTDRNRDREPIFLREPGGSQDSGWVGPNRVKMQQSSVAPGGTATFVFWMKASSGMAAGNYREYFRPVREGITWLTDYGIYWDVTVN